MFYRVEKLMNEVNVERYVEEFVNVEEFLEYCKKCSNFATKWSCPPYDFDVIEYWKQYKTLLILGYKIIFDEDTVSKEYTKEEIDRITVEVLGEQKKLITEELYALEEKTEGSVSLSAGYCNLCGDREITENSCTRKECPDGCAAELCRHPDKLRYSIEALGGNVGKTCNKILHDEIEWIEEGRLPSHFLLIGGLLKK